MRAKAVTSRRGLPDTGTAEPPPSTRRFPDGAAYRVEIPSVEGIRVLEAVVAAADEHGIVVNRVSQGSGAMLVGESELREMAALGAESGIEVSLFVGPRESFGVGAHSRSPEGAAHGGQLRGMRGLTYAIEDVVRATEAGIRSFLVADLGLLVLLRDMQDAGELPLDCGWKVSVAMAPSNPASIQLLETLGATTVNVPSDMTPAELAEMRAATTLPIDLYIESPDSLGGVVRENETASLVAAGAPLYAKFGLRNSQLLYPAGEHLRAQAISIAREKVARAAVALEWLHRLDPDLSQSLPGAEGLRVPRPAADALTSVEAG
ncbi:MAG: U32 family peptidase [Gaiella sp.]|nr:U32 family peptidase [Gaiella sp.]